MLASRRLRVLCEVARHGSFSAAAASLGYTQPAVSRQIATLEAEVGAMLVRRAPPGAGLTGADAVPSGGFRARAPGARRTRGGQAATGLVRIALGFDRAARDRAVPRASS